MTHKPLDPARTLSTKSLASDGGEGSNEKPDARSFLMKTAKRSLDEAFGSSAKVLLH